MQDTPDAGLASVRIIGFGSCVCIRAFFEPPKDVFSKLEVRNLRGAPTSSVRTANVSVLETLGELEYIDSEIFLGNNEALLVQFDRIPHKRAACLCTDWKCSSCLLLYLSFIRLNGTLWQTRTKTSLLTFVSKTKHMRNQLATAQYYDYVERNGGGKSEFSVWGAWPCEVELEKMFQIIRATNPKAL